MLYSKVKCQVNFKKDMSGNMCSILYLGSKPLFSKGFEIFTSVRIIVYNPDYYKLIKLIS